MAFPLGQSDRERSLHHFPLRNVNSEGSGEEAEPRRSELTADPTNRSARDRGLAPHTAPQYDRGGVRRRGGWMGQPERGGGAGKSSD